jgi:oxalate decarboxylase
MESDFFFSLDSIKPFAMNQAGSLTQVTSLETPGLQGISFAKLNLNAKGSLEPCWHPNANKIGYCIDGKALVSMRAPNGVETFTVNKGEIFFIPQGYVHHVENMGKNACTINFALNNESPETMWLSKAILSISDNVFNSTFDTKTGFVGGLRKSSFNPFKMLPSVNSTSEDIGSRYKFDIKDSNKAILTKGGYVQLGTKANLPLLNGLGILGFGLNPKGIVEPHWHTNAGELVYIVKGKARITILAPNGHVDILEVNGGEGAFAPASYFHNIENIGSDDVEVIAFFSNQDPDYIGIGEVVGSYSNELLASIFNTAPDYFNALKKREIPLVIVPI